MTRLHPLAATALAAALAGSLAGSLTACGGGSSGAGISPASGSATDAGASSAAGSVPASPSVADGGTSASPVVASTNAPATGSATGSATSACGLLTEAEVSTALGSDPGKGQGTTSGGASACLYGESPEFVSVNLVPSGGKADYDHTRAAAPAGTFSDVPGVGTAAFAVFRGPAGEIWFYQGDALVQVEVIDAAGTAPMQPRVVALAKAAAARV